MELEDFISQVLGQIVAGIRKAQSAESGAFIVPGGDGGHEYASHARVSSSARLKSTIVDFDIALTVEESKKSSGEGGVKVAGIGGSLTGESSSKDTRVSRIQFAVPLLLPESQRDWYSELKSGSQTSDGS